MFSSLLRITNITMKTQFLTVFVFNNINKFLSSTSSTVGSFQKYSTGRT